jgi:hypothetical protein
LTAKAEDKIGVIISDGHYTVGKDLRELAARYPKLFVIMTEDYDSKPDLCEDLARLGKGKMSKWLSLIHHGSSSQRTRGADYYF